MPVRLILGIYNKQGVKYFSDIIYHFLNRKLNFRTLTVKVVEVIIPSSNNNPVELKVDERLFLHVVQHHHE